MIGVLGQLHQAPGPEAVDEGLDVLPRDPTRASHSCHGLRPHAGQIDQHAALARHGCSVTVDHGGDHSQLAEGHDDLLDQFLDLRCVTARRRHDN